MDKEEILADFQACTGINDIGIAVEHLEKTDWNLLNAIQRAIPQHSQTLPSERSTQEENFFATFTMSDHNSSHNHFVPNDSVSASSNSSMRVNSDHSLRTVPTTTTATAKSSESATAMNVDTQTSFPPKAEINESDESTDIEDLTESYNDEDFLVPDTSSSGSRDTSRCLITNNVEDETTGTILFSESFILRYGHCHPMFFHGTLDEAVREATQRSAKDRKPLAIYLHHDGSVLSNIFCQQVLCAESVVSLLSNNFVVWGWDCTHEPNRQLLLRAVNQCFGTHGSVTIRSIEKDRYPVIIIFSRARASNEINNVIYGATGVDEVLGSLLHSLESYRAQQLVEVHEEEEREARERVIQEQNFAYQESLRADMAKEEAKRALESQKKQEEEQKAAQIVQIQNERKRVADLLPKEPEAGSTDPVCTLRCRLPNGKTAIRRFLKTAPLKTLYDFLFSEGFNKEKYKVLFSYPKRDLTEAFDENEMIGKVLSAQETIILEER